MKSDEWILLFPLAMLIALFAGSMYLMYDHGSTTASRKDFCTEAGGVPLVGDKGHFKMCLRKEALVSLEGMQ